MNILLQNLETVRQCIGIIYQSLFNSFILASVRCSIDILNRLVKLRLFPKAATQKRDIFSKQLEKT